MEWLSWQDASKDFLLVLHPPYTLILWNADTGEKVWKKSYTDVLDTFSLDPFSGNNLAFLTRAGNLMLVDDFSVSKTPSGNGNLFRISSLQSSQSATNIPALTGEDPRRRFLNMGAKLMNRQMFTGGGNSEKSGPREESPPVGGVGGGGGGEEGCPCVQITYFPAARNILLLVYPREVLVLDTSILQTLAHVILEKNMSPFLQVLPCAQREVVYFVQEHGCITMRIHNSKVPENAKKSIDIYNPAEVYFEGVASSESIRVTKSYRVFGAAICPTSERRIALIMSNGRIMFNEVMQQDSGSCSTKSLSDMIISKPDFTCAPVSKLRFVLNGLLNSLGSSPTVIRVQPSQLSNLASDDVTPMDPLPPSSTPARTHLTALGTAEGSIQLVDTLNGEIVKDFSVHSCPIRCMEWGGPLKVVSAGYSQTLSTSTVVRNELFATDIRTGLTKIIRPETEESPIDMLRVSFYYSYLAVAFRDQPMEVWDLKQFRLLRRMSKNCPVIIDMAWSGKHHQARVVKQKSEADDHPSEMLNQSHTDKDQQTIYRENLVVLDNENHLYHVVVKGMHVRDGKEVNTQWATTSTVNAMVWKDDFLAFGDNEGRISVWDLNSKQSKASPLTRGSVKRLQFSRSPGDHTLVVLHSDGVSLWNAAKDLHCKVLDVDLCGDAGLPVILTADGCLRAFDRSMTLQTAPVSDVTLQQVHCPALLPPSSAAVLKCVMRDVGLRKLYLGDEEGSSKLVEVIQCLDLSESEKELLISQMETSDEVQDDYEEILKEESVCKRNLLLGRWMGDEWECNLWVVASAALESQAEEGLEPEHHSRLQLPSTYDLLWEKDAFVRYEKRRCACFDSRRASYEQLNIIVEKLILLGQLDSSVQLLLNSDSSQPEYYQDSLKACLLSAVHSSSACQSTVKLVATNLIASGKLSEGTQLLCLIDKSLDACRYLQSSGHWMKAAWLAKVALSREECREVYRKWVDYLLTPQTLALLLLINLREWEKALEMLLAMKQVSTATHLLEIIGHEKISEQLRQDVYGEYARELENIGLSKAAIHYCQFAGQRGENIRKEIEILSSDNS